MWFSWHILFNKALESPSWSWSHLTALSQRNTLQYEAKIWRRNDLKFAHWTVFKRDVWLAIIVLLCIFFHAQICCGWWLLMITVMQLPGKNRGFWNVRSWLFFVQIKMKSEKKKKGFVWIPWKYKNTVLKFSLKQVLSPLSKPYHGYVALAFRKHCSSLDKIPIRRIFYLYKAGRRRSHCSYIIVLVYKWKYLSCLIWWKE